MLRDRQLDTLAIRDHQGRALARARVPRITRRFTSSLHTVANVAARTAGWQELLEQFLDGRLPVAQLVEESREPDATAELRQSVVAALDQGFSGGIATDVDGAVSARLAIPDAVAEAIDLASLRHDWLWWLNAAGVLDDEARTAVSRAITELEGRAFASYLWSMPAMARMDIAQALRHGVLVGDDPALTCAAVLRQLTDDARFWEECA